MFDIEILFNSNLLKQEGIPFMVVILSFLVMGITTIILTINIIKKRKVKK